MTQLNAKFKGPLMSTLKSSVDRRLVKFEKNTTFTIAALLDPRFKLRWANTDTERSTVKDSVIELMEAVNLQKPDTQTQPPPAKRQKVASDLFDFMAEEEEPNPVTSIAKQELEDYLSQP